MDPPLPEMPGGHLMLRQREPRTRDKAYKGFIAALPCIACARDGVTRYGVEVAHVRHGFPGWRPTGMAEKPSDFRCVPICAEHHRTAPDAQHQMREDRWWARLGVNPVTLCADLVLAFPDVVMGEVVIMDHAMAAQQFQRNPERSGGLSSPIEAAPKPVTVEAHLSGQRDGDGNLEIILPGVRASVRAFVAPEAVVAR